MPVPGIPAFYRPVIGPKAVRHRVGGEGQVIERINPRARHSPLAGSGQRRDTLHPVLGFDGMRRKLWHREPERVVPANPQREPCEARIPDPPEVVGNGAVDPAGQIRPLATRHRTRPKAHRDHDGLALIHATRRGSKYSGVPMAQSGTCAGLASRTRYSGTTLDTSRGMRVAMSMP